MLKNPKQAQNLPLQSYKIDHSHLQTKINELEQLKSELKSTLSRSRQDQNGYLNEINQLKKENEMLKNQIVKLQFTKKSQSMLIEQLEKNLEQLQNNLYDTQIQLEEQRSKRIEVQKQLELKLKQMKADKEEIVNHYEGQLLKISKVVQVNNTSQLKQIFNRAASNQESRSPRIQPRESMKIKRIKKASIEAIPNANSNSGIKEKYWMSNTIPEKQEDNSLTNEDIYLEMIRQVYKQLVKIQIKSKDLSKIPIISSFSQLRFPTINDVQRFFSNFPFEIAEKQRINLIHEFIVKEIERKGYQSTGKEIVKEITASLEEIEGQKEMSLVSGNSSAYLNDSTLSIGIKNDGPRRISKPQVIAALQYVGVSKGTIQQQSSFQSGESQLY